jgi:hypothetical protein
MVYYKRALHHRSSDLMALIHKRKSYKTKDAKASSIKYYELI